MFRCRVCRRRRIAFAILQTHGIPTASQGNFPVPGLRSFWRQLPGGALSWSMGLLVQHTGGCSWLATFLKRICELDSHMYCCRAVCFGRSGRAYSPNSLKTFLRRWTQNMRRRHCLHSAHELGVWWSIWCNVEGCLAVRGFKLWDELADSLQVGNVLDLCEPLGEFCPWSCDRDALAVPHFEVCHRCGARRQCCGGSSCNWPSEKECRCTIEGISSGFGLSKLGKTSEMASHILLRWLLLKLRFEERKIDRSLLLRTQSTRSGVALDYWML